MARAVVPDTSVLILRTRDRLVWPDFHRTLSSGRLWLPSVAITELYAGTRSREDSLSVDRIVAALRRIERVITPTEEEWETAGRLMARYVRLNGPIRPRDHLTDLLIVLAASRLGGMVITTNLRHFQLWAGVANAAGMDVTVSPLDAVGGA